MPLQRSIECDFEGCKTSYTEKVFGEGFPDWGHVAGVLKNGKEVYLCPEHKAMVIKFIATGGKP